MLLEFENDALAWAKLCHVERQITNGSATFPGNTCKTLLNKIEILRSFFTFYCLKYVQCFSDFQQVVKSCFSSDLHENFKSEIAKF